ncbi:MAG: hypothetical protein HY059_22120 [Proteobacteria bacterium]|nr:hypothetical protein [Pseudomonadota bacterium]
MKKSSKRRTLATASLSALVFGLGRHGMTADKPLGIESLELVDEARVDVDQFRRLVAGNKDGDIGSYVSSGNYGNYVSDANYASYVSAGNYANYISASNYASYVSAGNYGAVPNDTVLASLPVVEQAAAFRDAQAKAARPDFKEIKKSIGGVLESSGLTEASAKK